MASSAMLTLPDLGEGLTQARVLSLLTPAGGKIEVDAPVVVVETDKSVVELPAPLTGYVAEWFVRESDVVRVGEPLARFDAEAATGMQPRMPAALAPPAPAPPVAAPPAAAPQPAPAAPRNGEQRARISPAARRRARDLGIELDAVVANGAPHGTISAQTVQRFSEQSRSAAAAAAPATSAAPAASAATAGSAAPAAAAPAAGGTGTLVVLSRRLDVALLRDGTAWLGLAETVAKALFRATRRVAGRMPHATLPAGLRVRRFGEPAERRWFATDFAGGGLAEAPVPAEPGAGDVWDVVYAPGDVLTAFAAGPARAVAVTFCAGSSPSLSLVSTDPGWGEEAVLLLWDEIAAALHSIAFDLSSAAGGRVP